MVRGAQTLKAQGGSLRLLEEAHGRTSMNPVPKFLSGLAAAGLMLSLATVATAAEKVRVALGDVVSVETLAFVVALERAKDRGRRL